MREILSYAILGVNARLRILYFVFPHCIHDLSEIDMFVLQCKNHLMSFMCSQSWGFTLSLTANVITDPW